MGKPGVLSADGARGDGGCRPAPGPTTNGFVKIRAPSPQSRSKKAKGLINLRLLNKAGTVRPPELFRTPSVGQEPCFERHQGRPGILAEECHFTSERLVESSGGAEQGIIIFAADTGDAGAGRRNLKGDAGCRLGCPAGGCRRGRLMFQEHGGAACRHCQDHGRHSRSTPNPAERDGGGLRPLTADSDGAQDFRVEKRGGIRQGADLVRGGMTQLPDQTQASPVPGGAVRTFRKMPLQGGGQRPAVIQPGADPESEKSAFHERRREVGGGWRDWTVSHPAIRLRARCSSTRRRRALVFMIRAASLTANPSP